MHDARASAAVQPGERGPIVGTGRAERIEGIEGLHASDATLGPARIGKNLVEGCGRRAYLISSRDRLSRREKGRERGIAREHRWGRRGEGAS